MANTYFKNKLRAGTAMTVIFAAGLLTSTPAYADCVISGDGLTLTCSGDLLAGEDNSSATITQINLSGLTTNIGGNGFSFINTASDDIMFNIDLGSFNISLPFANDLELTSRRGLHLTSGGALEGSLTGDIIDGGGEYNAAGSLYTVFNNQSNSTTSLGSISIDGLVFRAHSFAALGLEAETGIRLTNVGDILAIKPDLIVSNTTALEMTTGRFAGIFLATTNGSVNLSNTGDITVDGGSHSGTVIRTDGDRALATYYQGDLDAAVPSDTTHPDLLASGHFGITAVGSDELTINQIGNINLSGGDVVLRAQAQDSSAVTEAVQTQAVGIFVTDDHYRTGERDSNFTGGVDIVMDGDINITGANITARSIVESTAAGQTPERAIAIIRNDGSSVSPFGTNTAGIYVQARPTSGSSAQVVDSLEFNGDMVVSSGTTTTIALAPIASATQTGGLTAAYNFAQSTYGIFMNNVVSNLIVNGSINVEGVHALAEVSGSGSADRRSTNEGARVVGGAAFGITFSMTDNANIDINAAVRAVGGRAELIASGSNFNVNVVGGSAFGIINDVTNDLFRIDNIIEVVGGQADVTITGHDIGGSATG